MDEQRPADEVGAHDGPAPDAPVDATRLGALRAAAEEVLPPVRTEPVEGLRSNRSRLRRRRQATRRSS